MGRWSVRLVAAIIGVVLLAPAAQAAQSGQTGSYAVVDTRAQPAVACVFPDDWGRLQGVMVRAPRVWAADISSGTDNQLVGFRFIVKHVAQTTTVVYRSSVQTAMASDTEPAAFADSAGSFAAPAPGRYVVAIKMLWFGDGNAVSGWAKYRVRHYSTVTVSGDEGRTRISCPFGLA